MAEAIVRPFGKIGEQIVNKTTLRTLSGFEVEVLDYGAIVRSFLVPLGSGERRDIVLGLDDLESYLKCSIFMGGVVGRVANRIGHSRFQLDGRDYRLFANDPPHHLHGGKRGWDRVLWSSQSSVERDRAAVVLRYHSPAGEEGYPGAVDAEVEYSISESGEFQVAMRARSDALTPVNMAQHNYWNLGGHASGSTLGHEVTLYADEYTPGEDRIPYGQCRAVAGTALDFRTARTIGDGIAQMKGEPLGFDHNYVVRGEPKALRPVAYVREPTSGLSMKIEANQPGVQYYSGTFMDGTYQGKGAKYDRYTGLCLETQAFPNAINVPAWASQVLLEPGKLYDHVMRFTFDGVKPA
jgi:aldose 1-epimerase